MSKIRKGGGGKKKTKEKSREQTINGIRHTVCNGAQDPISLEDFTSQDISQKDVITLVFIHPPSPATGKRMFEKMCLLREELIEYFNSQKDPDTQKPVRKSWFAGEPDLPMTRLKWDAPAFYPRYFYLLPMQQMIGQNDYDLFTDVKRKLFFLVAGAPTLIGTGFGVGEVHNKRQILYHVMVHAHHLLHNDSKKAKEDVRVVSLEQFGGIKLDLDEIEANEQFSVTNDKQQEVLEHQRTIWYRISTWLSSVEDEVPDKLKSPAELSPVLMQNLKHTQYLMNMLEQITTVVVRFDREIRKLKNLLSISEFLQEKDEPRPSRPSVILQPLYQNIAAAGPEITKEIASLRQRQKILRQKLKKDRKPIEKIRKKLFNKARKNALSIELVIKRQRFEQLKVWIVNYLKRHGFPITKSLLRELDIDGYIGVSYEVDEDEKIITQDYIPRFVTWKGFPYRMSKLQETVNSFVTNVLQEENTFEPLLVDYDEKKSEEYLDDDEEEEESDEDSQDDNDRKEESQEENEER
jgi:hypothetical protein